MPSVVIKPDTFADFYVIWSTVTDSPMFCGDRAAVLAELKTGGYGEGDEQRLARADERGSSAMGGWRFGWWDEDEFLTNWDAAGNREVGPRLIARRDLARWLQTGDESLPVRLSEEQQP